MTHHRRLVRSNALSARLRITVALMSLVAMILAACAQPGANTPAAEEPAAASSGGDGLNDALNPRHSR